MRTLIVGTCKPGKEFRASEEIMDIIMHYDPTVMLGEYGKGIVVGSSELPPETLKDILKGKVMAYVNNIYLGNELCEKCKALRKGCVINVEEGREAVCVGKAKVRIAFWLKNKGGVLVLKGND